MSLSVGKFYKHCVSNNLEFFNSIDSAAQNNLSSHHAIMAWAIQSTLNGTTELPAVDQHNKDYLMKFKFYNKDVINFYCDCIKLNLNEEQIENLGNSLNLQQEIPIAIDIVSDAT